MQHHTEPPNLPNRQSIRLDEHDYSRPGEYFVTICTQHREPFFGAVHDGTMHLNGAGCMVEATWERMPDRFPTVKLDEYVIMPNHFHSIVWLRDDGDVDGQRAATRAAPTLGDVIGAFKSLTTNQYIMGVHEHNWPPFDRQLWQRNYYEHIIHNTRALHAIRAYIMNNPRNWHLDRYNPNHAGPDPRARRLWKMLRSSSSEFPDESR